MADANDLIVKTYGKLNTIFAENDQMLFGGMQAAEDAGLKEGIYYAAAADGEKKTCDYIKEGKVVAGGENSPVQIAKLAAQTAREVLVDGKDPTSYPDTVTTDAVAVTKENVDEEYENCFGCAGSGKRPNDRLLQLAPPARAGAGSIYGVRCLGKASASGQGGCMHGRQL